MKNKKIILILILVMGAGLFLYYQFENFFAERELALQVEILQAYDLGVEDGKLDLHNEWKEAGRKEVVSQILNELALTGELKIINKEGDIMGTLIPK